MALATFTFLLLKFLPGSPLDGEVAHNPEVRQQFETLWGLNKGWFHQWGYYLKNILKGDFGVSMVQPDVSVGTLIKQGLFHSLSLNVLAFLIVSCLAIFLAVISMKLRHTVWEKIFDQFFIAGVSLPSLFWGPVVIFVFAYKLEWFPLAFLESPAHYVLPLMTLSLRPICILARFLKNSMAEVVRSDYVRTAVAKGMSDWQVLLRHVLKNSWIPFLSYLGPLSVSLISGSFLVELLFAIPGLGSIFISALNERDHTVIMGLTLFYGSLLIVVNLGIDFLIKITDPRIRQDSQEST